MCQSRPTSDLLWSLHEEYPSLIHLWREYEGYQHAADHQIARVTAALWEVGKRDAMSLDPVDDDAQRGQRSLLAHQALSEAHLFLGCWAVIARYVMRIEAILQDETVTNLVRGQDLEKLRTNPKDWQAISRDSIAWYVVGRDQMEQFDARIVARDTRMITALSQSAPQEIGVVPTGPEGIALSPSLHPNGQLQMGNCSWDISYRAHRRRKKVLARFEAQVRAIAASAIEARAADARARRAEHQSRSLVQGKTSRRRRADGKDSTARD